ncbi:hypothetical protein TTHERM_00382180 (macronuclear) [Tetrahymena thermophila SB210]|uniref:Uncharacterized protein n=1 Tax=Tetrahymena thermophila (strain SB210) TaxID=312017 RepID=Q23F96_TETTS|nr:hypothetical protein TTHERM_00382180 [Tetrahymena thermophila SB210]EAR95257.2 hypothetical protein TTHERM_00382180 [Tetrahymena thermophila SB210]|eukprot:XP_001015502.2 hypothetical protein TTHERM_00382180 [Tetrahymena thermophila SB210]
MELLKDGEKKVLHDYQQRLNQLNEKPEISTNNNSQVHGSKIGPLNRQTLSEYVNNCIQKQLEAKKDFQKTQDNSLQQSFERPNSKEKQDYIKNGRFKVPSVNLFAQNFEGNLPKNVDFVNKSSNDMYAQEQNNYDPHLNSIQISQQLNQLIQRGVLTEKKREEKTQLFENVIQNTIYLTFI